ncbi:MAG: hypothetical protein AB1750_15915 [Chloroflexota bacterium]
MFRRPLRRAMIRQAARPAPAVPPMLRRAHELMAAGNYVAAAETFEQLGRAGEARGHPKTATMFLQGGRARIMAGQNQPGYEDLMRGLTVLSKMGRPGQLFHTGNRVVAELNERGMSKEAAQIADWLKTNLPPRPEGAAPGPTVAPTRKPVLPTHCPGCGGPVNSQDVEWLDDVTAECNWCGSPLRGE